MFNGARKDAFDFRNKGIEILNRYAHAKEFDPNTLDQCRASLERKTERVFRAINEQKDISIINRLYILLEAYVNYLDYISDKHIEIMALEMEGLAILKPYKDDKQINTILIFQLYDSLKKKIKKAFDAVNAITDHYPTNEDAKNIKERINELEDYIKDLNRYLASQTRLKEIKKEEDLRAEEQLAAEEKENHARPSSSFRP